MKNLIQLVFSGIATMLSFLLGGFDVAIEALLVFIVTDYITGLLKAWKTGKLNSRIGAEGIVKKVGYLIIVILAVYLDRLAGDIGVIRNIVIYFFIANEGISILENWGAMGVPFPKILREKLEQLKGVDSDGKES